jgi:Spy/CpxP family protein refolding chaperone
MALCSIAMAAGVLGVVALVKRLVFRRRLALHGGPWGSMRFGWGRGGGIGQSFWLRALYARLDTTPGQEREIRTALEELRDRARDAKNDLPETRENIARSIAGDAFDVSAFEAVSARVDGTASKLKDAFASALKRIHGVLDASQRARFAEILGKGGLPRWHRGGPYRSSSR